MLNNLMGSRVLGSIRDCNYSFRIINVIIYVTGTYIFAHQLTSGEVSRVLSDSYQFGAGPQGPGSSVYQMKISAFQGMRFEDSD